MTKIINEAKQGKLDGEIGIYYELMDYDKDSFVEDGKINDLDDSDIIVPYFQVNYLTPEYIGFSIGVGLTGYTHINGDSDRDNTVDDYDRFVFHQLYLEYSISQTALKIGRQEIEKSILLSDYYEALSLTTEDINNLFFIFAVVDKVSESDIDKFIEFQNINREDESIDDYLYAGELTWNIIPDAIGITAYYYYQENLYKLYGTHIELLHELEEIGLGLYGDFYATDEDNTNGLRDANNEVKNSHIYHISPFIKANNFNLAGGYIEADHEVGGREGGLIDDYFNPFNEGDKAYEPDAKTWYGTLSYESDRFDAGVVFGRTDYLDDTKRLREEEFDIKAGFSFLENFRFETEMSFVNSESPEGDFKVFEAALTYEF